ncbi:hypothetical protein AJ87_07685 [Rhizobium yanglingense]|nr:hypothetical protein AJ87_07685 [Rhizobium yanglingense]
MNTDTLEESSFQSLSLEGKRQILEPHDDMQPRVGALDHDRFEPVRVDSGRAPERLKDRTIASCAASNRVVMFSFDHPSKIWNFMRGMMRS